MIKSLRNHRFQKHTLTQCPSMVEQLHVFFFPMLAQGHMLPILDMANLFSSRGVKSTLITTQYHIPAFEQAIRPSIDSGSDISVRGIKFPAQENGLPEGTESVELVKSQELMPNFTKAIFMLQDQLENLLQQFRPHCLVSDSFFPWTTDVAAKFGIPRLVFDGVGCFPSVVREILRLHRPFDHVSSDSEEFLVPDIPHQIKLTIGQVPLYDRQKEEAQAVTGVMDFFQQVRDSNSKSFGTIVNSFYELEPDYADKMGRKTWHVGPLFLCNNVEDEVVQTEKKSDIEEWLDLKSPNSVVYICFGSRTNFKAAQLHEIAKGLEITGRNFIWVVRGCADEEDQEKWLPTGFSDRSKDKGLVVKGWAPQIPILRHDSVGAFVTHCGWNSTLEGVGCGVPLVTWPLFAEQFLNEKLLVDVLRVGVGVGSKQWSWVATDTAVKGEAFAKAVERVMAGDEGLEMRERCAAMKELAGKCVEEGGSSYNRLNELVKEIKAFHSER